MPIDAFDKEYLAQEGTGQKILKRILGLELGSGNARKYNTGIKHYLNYKSKLKDDDILQPDDMEEIVIKADGSKTTTRMLLLSEEDSKDPHRIMVLMGFDPLQWDLQLCKIRRSNWDVTIKNKAKTGVKHTNHAFMCTVTCKPIQDILTTEYVKEVFADLKPPSIAKVKHIKGDKMLEIPIMDLHLGKNAPDAGNAKELYKSAVLDILGGVKEYGLSIEKIVFPIGQDFYHADNDKSTTTRGTLVDTNCSWSAMYRLGVELLFWAIEQCRQIAPVECMYVAGNHDMVLSYCAAMTIDHKYKDADDVTVNTAASPRKYVEYGKCLIGFSHGNKEGKRIETIMQIEQPEAWGRTKYREFHLGHLHHEMAKEIGGIVIRRISTVTEADQWHIDGGWLGAIRKAQAFIWDKERGKILTIDSNVIINDKMQLIPEME